LNYAKFEGIDGEDMTKNKMNLDDFVQYSIYITDYLPPFGRNILFTENVIFHSFEKKNSFMV